MQIKKDLYYVSGGLFGQLGNVYAIKHDDGYVLIDAGNPNACATILENLAYWGIQETQITHVLLTHGHDDHAGCAHYFQSKGAKIVVGNGDNQMLQEGNLGKDSPFLNHQMPTCIPDIIIDKDTKMNIGGIGVSIYTMPGHTNGFLVYHITLNEEAILFTGDMFFCDGEKGDLAYTGWKGDMNYNPVLLQESFKKLWELNLPITIVLGGHGNPRIGSGAKEQIMIAYKYCLINNR